MKKIAAILTCLLLVSTLTITAFATTASASLSGPKTVRAEDTITLTFSLQGKNIYGVSGKLSYDTNQLELMEIKKAATDSWFVEFNKDIFIAYDNQLSKPVNGSMSVFSATFKVKSGLPTGTIIKVSCNEVATSDGKADNELGTVSYSAVLEKPLSAENTLKSLTLSTGALNPVFSGSITAYSLEVPFSVEKLKVDAVAVDPNAKIQMSCPELIAGGITNVIITVTAENGSVKTYTIEVKRGQDPNYVASNNCTLKELTVEGFLLSPAYDPEITRYVVWLPYETERVTVEATAADSKGSVRIEGGDNLIAGADNEIKVICIAEDGTQKVYTVIAKRAPAHDGSTEPSAKPETNPTTEPTTAPTEPQKPVEQDSDGSIQMWVVIVIGIACLAIGAVGGFFGRGIIRKN